MKYVSTKVFAYNRGVTVRWIQELCREGKIKGATRLPGSGMWMIPEDAEIEIVPKKIILDRTIMEGNNMSNAIEQMKTGQKLLEEFNLDMAAVYFEFAGEEFIRANDYESALESYEKVLYCFTTDEKLSRVDEIKRIIAEIKTKI